MDLVAAVVLVVLGVVYRLVERGWRRRAGWWRAEWPEANGGGGRVPTLLDTRGGLLLTGTAEPGGPYPGDHGDDEAGPGA